MFRDNDQIRRICRELANSSSTPEEAKRKIQDRLGDSFSVGFAKPFKTKPIEGHNPELESGMLFSSATGSISF